ncbi:MAG: LL-diaminopimelate aminotransferase [Verrucomicrobiota bacterium]|jgi:LL-diaminopimelate aminotransferase
MAKINPHYSKLGAGYLFPEIARRTRSFLSEHPDATVMRLGIGDTTEAIPGLILEGIREATDKLGSPRTYSGYGDSEGQMPLREALSDYYHSFGVDVPAGDIWISDGAKSDSANIQSIFATDNVVAVQDPAYPVYVDSQVMSGRTGPAVNGCYEGLVYMPCTEDNGFFPELPDRKVDLIYICSPNNPTGAVATHEQLKMFVDYAIENRAIILFDSAYAAFIQDDALPRSIYAIEGARTCAIEISSFSKYAGFTGVRLGWTIVPEELVAEETSPGEVKALWTRRQNTFFNGASNVVQGGGLAALSDEGLAACRMLITYYLENAAIIQGGLDRVGITTFGGKNAPYVWMKTPDDLDSWTFFDKLLGECHVVGTPGAGFGPGGEGYFRLSAFGHRDHVKTAVASITSNLKLG